MSIRDSLTNAHPSFTASSPPSPVAGVTVCGWVWISVDNNDFSTICRLHSASGGSTCVVIGFQGDGTTPSVFSASGTVLGSSCTVGAWYFLGFTLTGPNVANFYQALGQGTLTQTSGSVTPGAAPTGLTFFGRSAGDSSETLNGRLWNWRMWSGAHTPAEMAAEQATATIGKSAGLYGQWMMPSAADLTDSFGGHDLVANTGALTTEADPPFGQAGTATLTLGATGVQSRTATSSGTATMTLGAAGTAAAQRPATGTGQLVLGATGAASKSAVATGTAALVLGGSGPQSAVRSAAEAAVLTLIATGSTPAGLVHVAAEPRLTIRPNLASAVIAANRGTMTITEGGSG